VSSACSSVRRPAGARHLVVRLGALDLGSQRDQLEQVAALIPSLLNQAQSPVAL
jgi:hypothetical protein